MAFKHFFCIGLFCVIATAASADSFSFQGTFQTDNDVQLFSFTIAADSTVTFLTLGYAGGTNAAGTVIPAGGFDSLLTLFDSSGNYIGSWDNSPGEVPSGPDGTLDAYDSQEFNAGTYTLALTESPNVSVDTSLADGFNGNGNPYGCDFCDLYSTPLDAQWAVDINTVDSAFEEGPSATTPEPGSLILLSSGLGCFSWVRRRKLFGARHGN